MTEPEENPEYKEFIVKQTKKELLRCFWPMERCKEKPIKAHSIQNSRILAFLADNGHVIMPRAKQDFDFGPKVEFRLIGRNEASTFTGLCGKHDKILFKSIEGEKLDLSSEQNLFLLAYRAVLRELHSKMETTINIQRVYEKGCKDGKFDPAARDPMFWIATMGMAESYSFYRYKFYYDLIYKERLYHQLIHEKLSVQSNSPLIAVNSLFDVFDNMKRYENRMDPKLIALNIFPLDGVTHIIFSFRKDHEAVLRPILDPILSASGHYQLYLISKLILRHCENFVISPIHFKTFSQVKIESMIKYFSKNISVNKEDYEDEQLYLF